MPPADTTLTNAQLTARIALHGAELRSLVTASGDDLQWDGDPAVWQGRAPILFPVIGALNGGGYRLDGVRYAMPKHGFARHSDFSLIAADAQEARLRLSPTDATRAIYPFEFQLDLVYSLAGATLTIAAEIANHGPVVMPASIGFHPALRWPLPFGRPRGDHAITFAQEEPDPIRRIDHKGLLRVGSQPTPVVGSTLALRDDLFMDDALIFDALRSRELLYGAPCGPRVRLRFADFPLLGVWTKSGAAFICIEPWHGVSDPEGFAGDLRDKPGIFMVASGDVRRMAMDLTYEAQRV